MPERVAQDHNETLFGVNHQWIYILAASPQGRYHFWRQSNTVQKNHRHTWSCINHVAICPGSQLSLPASSSTMAASGWVCSTPCVVDIWSQPLREATEECELESQKMNATSMSIVHIPGPPPKANREQDPMIYESISQRPELWKFIEKSEDFIAKLRREYWHNSLLSKVILEPEHYRMFSHQDGALYLKNHGSDKVLCVPCYITNDYSLTATVIE